MRVARPELPVTGYTTEAGFQRAVIEYARARGWRCYSHADSRRATAGWPDLVLLRPPKALFVELKTDIGKARPAQKETLNILARCDDMETYLWRPKHWESIMEILE